MGEAAALSHHPHPINMLPPTPAGLETLYNLCRKIYPDQANPLQVTALLKFWYVYFAVATHCVKYLEQRLGFNSAFR